MQTEIYRDSHTGWLKCFNIVALSFPGISGGFYMIIAWERKRRRRTPVSNSPREKFILLACISAYQRFRARKEMVEVLAWALKYRYLRVIFSGWRCPRPRGYLDAPLSCVHFLSFYVAHIQAPSFDEYGTYTPQPRTNFRIWLRSRLDKMAARISLLTPIYIRLPTWRIEHEYMPHGAAGHTHE